MADDPFLLRDLWTASWMSKGSAPTAGDETYWRENSAGMLERGPQINHRSPVFPDWEPGRAYRMDRMLGWQSGGADVPPYGNWANPPTPFHTVAVFPGDAPAPEPTPEPLPSPEPTPLPDLPLAAIVDRLEHIETFLRAVAVAVQKIVTAVTEIRDKQNPPYRGEVAYPASVRGGTRTMHLTPDLKPGADGTKR